MPEPYLKDDRTAREYLKSDALEAFSRGAVTLHSK